MEKKEKVNTYVEELAYSPSKKVSEIEIDETELASENLKNDPEYKQYLKLKEKFAPLEKAKKNNPILRIVLKLFAAIVIIYLILFTIGFIMGKNGYKPQQLDWNVITNQLNGDEEKTSDFSELEKVSEVEKVKDQSETS